MSDQLSPSLQRAFDVLVGNHLPVPPLVRLVIEFADDLFKGELVTTLKMPHPCQVSVVVLLNGTMAASNRDDVLVWDVEKVICLQTLAGHTDLVLAIAVLPDGKLLTCSRDRTVCMWNPETGLCLLILLGHTKDVTTLAVLSDNTFASGSDDATVRLWNTSGACLKIIPLLGQATALTAAGNKLFIGSDVPVCEYDVATGDCALVNNGAITPGALLPLPRNELAMSLGHQVFVLDADRERQRNLVGHIGYVSALAVLPNGNLVSGSRDKTFCVWDVDSRECLKTHKRYAGWVCSLAVFPDGRLVVGSSDGFVNVWR